MKINVNNKEYTFLVGYRKEDQYRAALSDLAKKIFGISFEDWYKAGYWNEKYIPYTLFDGEKAVANVSANIMDFNVFGERQRYIQLGTVMTDDDYRNKNLSRFLMEKILSEWRDKCKLIYLYANSSVLDFYPKFGFSRVKEHVHFKQAEKNTGDFEKLNMDVQSNRDMLHDYAKNSKAFGKISMSENADLVMFYCTSFLKENVYYIKPLDVIVVATFNDNQLHLSDVFGKTKIELDKIIESLGGAEINEVLLGFTPEDCKSYEIKEASGDDVLFVQKGKEKLFDENKVMFPLLSHA